MLSEHRRDLRLAAWRQHHEARLALDAEADGVIGGGVAGVQCRDDIDARRQFRAGDGVGHRQVEKAHAIETQALGEVTRLLHQFLARLDADHLRAVAVGCRRQRLEEQVVENEAEVGLAGAVIDQRDVRVAGHDLPQQRFDEVVQVIDLLQLAPAVLVQPRVAREDVQFLQQFDGLAGPDGLGDVRGHRRRRLGRNVGDRRPGVGFLHAHCGGPAGTGAHR